MRALLLFYYFPPSGGPGVQRGLKLCRLLPQQGVQPALVTADPGVFAGLEEYSGDPSLLDAVPPGLRVTRTAGGDRPGLRSWLSRARLLRPAQHLWPRRFFERQAGWFGPALEATLGEIEQFRPDVLLTSSQPYVAHLVGREAKRRTGIPWVADFRDPWTRSWGRRFASRRAFRWEERREQEVLSAADVVVMNTPGSRDELLAQHPWLAPPKVRVVRNGYDEEDLEGPPAERPDDAVLVVHVGSFRARAPGPERTGLRAWIDSFEHVAVPYDLSTHSPGPLLEALALLSADADAPRVTVRLIGSLSEGWRRRARELGVEDRLEILGYLPHRAALRHLRAADLLYLPTLTRTDGEPVSNVPAKTYEYLGSGRPMAVLAGPGDVRETVGGRARVTLLEPGDVAGLAARIRSAVRARGAAVRARGAAFPVDPPDAHGFRRSAVAAELAEALHAARDRALR